MTNSKRFVAMKIINTLQASGERHMQPRFCSVLCTLIAPALVVLAFVSPAIAHPHVWVTVKATVAYENEQIAGLQHRWTFDDMYTAMAIQGLDTNGDGTYDKDELKELAQVNIDGLKEFAYFTHAKLNDKKWEIGQPKDYWLEHKDGILTLHFMLPFAQPVAAKAEGFSFAIYDDSYYIAFDLAKDTPIRLGEGAPAGCAVSVAVPPEEEAEAKLLSESFSEQFDGYANIAASLAKTASISCSQS